MDIKTAYAQVQHKYKLPPYETLNSEFELLYASPVIEITYPLRFIRRRINDKIYWICNMIQSIMQPNPSSLVNMHEASAFSKEDKEHLSTLLKDLMRLERTSFVIDIKHSEQGDATFIKDAFSLWKEKKKDITAFANKLVESWTLEEKKQKKDHYFG